MNRSKWLATVLAGAAIVTLAGCSTSAATPGASAAKEYKIGVVLKTSNAYFTAMQAGINAMPKTGFKFLGVVSPGDGTDATSQITAIEGMMAQGANAIAVAPVGPQVEPTLNRAVAAGIKIILIDNNLAGWKGATSYVGTDNLAGGLLAGKYLATQMNGKGTIAVMSGVPGVPALDDRVNGMLDGLKGTEIKVVTTLPTDCDQTKGVNVMQAFASSHPEVDAIYSACGPPILGAIEARAKADPFKKGLLIVGFDGLPDEAKAILAGTESASVAQYPKKMGTTAITTAFDALNGKKVESVIDTGTLIVTKDNAQTFTSFQ